MGDRRLLVLACLIATLAGAGSAQAAGYHRTGTYVDQGTARWRPTADVKLDSHRIPVVRRPGGWAHNPVTIASVGLSDYSYALRSGDRGSMRAAVRMARWFVRNQRRDGTWPYRYDFPVAGMDLKMKAPWSSAMAQGMAASLLRRAYARTCHRTFIRTAARGLAPLTRPVSRGGLTARLRGGAFYEEYPTRPASFTLNGFMYTLIGLYDLRDVSPRAGRLFRAGRRTLIRNLHLYETGGISAYHLGFRTKPPRPILKSLKYHRVHVVGLTVLNRMDPSPTMRRYRDRWARLLPGGKPPRLPSKPAPRHACG